MANTSVRTPVLAILALLLSVSTGLALPVPPNTVVAQPFTPDDPGEDVSFILLTWESVDGADSYRIWRAVRVDRALDEAGLLVDLDRPEDALVVWGVVDAVERETPVVRAIVAAGDGDMTRWAVTTVQQTGDGPLESGPRFHSAGAGPVLPAPPETVTAAPYTPEGEAGEDGFILLSWDAVEGADGYRIWRQMQVDRVLDEAGHLVELDTPGDALVVWDAIDLQPGQPVIRAIVPGGESHTRWAVTTVRNTADGQLESELRFYQMPVEGVGTAVQARSWGDVKQSPRKDAR